MAKTLTTKLRFTLDAEYVDDTELNAQRGHLVYVVSDEMATGTAAEQSDQKWHDTRTAAAAVDNIDLAGGVTDEFGDVLTFVKVRTLFIRNNSTTAAHILTIGGATTNPISTIWTDTSDKEPIGTGSDGWMLKHNPTDGYAITAGSADVLMIDPGTNTVSYDIIVIGTSS